jgi:hypothetical protein
MAGSLGGYEFVLKISLKWYRMYIQTVNLCTCKNIAQLYNKRSVKWSNYIICAIYICIYHLILYNYIYIYYIYIAYRFLLLTIFVSILHMFSSFRFDVLAISDSRLWLQERPACALVFTHPEVTQPSVGEPLPIICQSSDQFSCVLIAKVWRTRNNLNKHLLVWAGLP